MKSMIFKQKLTKAEVSFKFMMEARNKLVETYKEVMRMQM
ncbi:MAG: Flagellar hook-basal body complex protein FliE [Candidatus Brocadiaceae bacterium]|nr:Flagellar hook-basal body complex protein FliE [Candidatus Brocadiaceae bacterium]